MTWSICRCISGTPGTKAPARYDVTQIVCCKLLCSGLRGAASFVSLPGGLANVTATVTYLLREKRVWRQLALFCNKRRVERCRPWFDVLVAAGEQPRGLLEKALQLETKKGKANSSNPSVELSSRRHTWPSWCLSGCSDGKVPGQAVVWISLLPKISM